MCARDNVTLIKLGFSRCFQLITGLSQLHLSLFQEYRLGFWHSWLLFSQIVVDGLRFDVGRGLSRDVQSNKHEGHRLHFAFRQIVSSGRKFTVHILACKQIVLLWIISKQPLMDVLPFIIQDWSSIVQVLLVKAFLSNLQIILSLVTNLFSVFSFFF